MNLKQLHVYLSLIVLVQSECITHWDQSMGSHMMAEAIIKSDPSNNQYISGYVKFDQDGYGPVHVEAHIINLDDGYHGWHVHVNGDVSRKCDDAGLHFNPFKMDHGDVTADIRHEGDLGNLKSYYKVADISLTDSLMQLSGPDSIVGRAVVIHANKDDLGLGGFNDSKIVGHSGKKLACGEICYVIPPSNSYSTGSGY